MPTRTAGDSKFKGSLVASIREKMKHDHLSISELAHRMGTGRTAVRRILDPSNTSITFRSMERLARAVGLQIKLVAERMSPEDLGKLAHRLAGNEDPEEAAKLAEEITRGFYAGA